MPSRSPAAERRSARRLALFLTGSGALHLLVPKFYDQMIPTPLPGSPRSWTLGSGVAEIAVGAAVALPRTRRLGALAALTVFVGVFPANIKMALDARAKPERAPVQAALLARLPLQLPMMTWALRVRRNA
jgi:uncharacterized membrane protein